jgi:opacity protein-like surface antigen
MKKLILCVTLILPCLLQAQIGIKAGLNFANVTNASSINNSSRTGYHAGIFLAPTSKGVISSRTELIYSRQGYDFKSGTNTGSVNLNYIMLPQLMSINITKYFSLQLGAQMAYLLNAKVDSTNGNGNGSGNGIMDLYNRFDYGYAAGVEVHPVSGLLIGARMSISLAKLYKSAQSGQMPSFEDVDIKNNVFQIFAGWRFGGKSKEAK